MTHDKRRYLASARNRKPTPESTLVSPHALMRALKAHPLWRRRIGPWLAGKPVGDAPARNGRGHDSQIYVNEREVRFIGPFAEVSATQTDDNEWLAAVSYCANPARQFFTHTDKLVEAFCGSVWHIAIRGVIG